MIAGHTKFKVDGNFGLIKKKYRKSTIYWVDDFVEVVQKSSPAGLNKTQRYEDGQGFQYLDFKVLERYFRKLSNIQRYHHFLFESSNLGVVKVQEFANGDFIEFDLWKDKDKIIESIQEIKNLIFPILTPEPLSLERQEYLYKNICLSLPEGFRKGICPVSS
ncbi:Chaperonin [endosymbiont GvMRE of Glomus versiforme]|nr:Chaperonin [endosymbiont GvMRE of Glomus versiforme]